MAREDATPPADTPPGRGAAPPGPPPDQAGGGDQPPELSAKGLQALDAANDRVGKAMSQDAPDLDERASLMADIIGGLGGKASALAYVEGQEDEGDDEGKAGKGKGDKPVSPPK